MWGAIIALIVTTGLCYAVSNVRINITVKQDYKDHTTKVVDTRPFTISGFQTPDADKEAQALDTLNKRRPIDPVTQLLNNLNEFMVGGADDDSAENTASK